MLQQTTVPEIDIAAFVPAWLKSVGISPDGTGKYEVREQIITAAGKLVVNKSSHATQEEAAMIYNRPVAGQLEFKALVAPDGTVIQTDGIRPHIKRPRKWLPVVIGVGIAAGIGAVAFAIARR